MPQNKSAKNGAPESVLRIEPARLEQASEEISNVVADVSAAAARLGASR
jgi:hypothetical protein